MKNRQEIPSLVKIGQKYRAFYVKTPVVYSLLLLATLNRRKSALFELNGSRMFGGRQGIIITRRSYNDTLLRILFTGSLSQLIEVNLYHWAPSSDFTLRKCHSQIQ
jgi:hypothetical protein